jgi:hypothetical protein
MSKPFAAGDELYQRWLNPLAEQLEAHGVDADALSAMSPSARRSALVEAARRAETAAAAAAGSLNMVVDDNTPESAVFEAHGAISRLMLVEWPYLTPAKRQYVREVKFELDAWKRRRSEQYARWRTELPGKIRAEYFDGKTTFAKTRNGWLVADESPFPNEDDTLISIVDRRISESQDASAPAGRWNRKGLRDAQAALARPEIRAAAVRESGSGEIMKLEDRLDAAIEKSLSAEHADAAALSGALSRVKSPGAGAGPVLRLAKYYERIARANLPRAMRQQAAEFLASGSGSFPSVSELESIKEKVYSRQRSDQISELIVSASASIFGLIPALFGRGSWDIRAALVVVATAFIVLFGFAFVRAAWRRYQLKNAWPSAPRALVDDYEKSIDAARRAADLEKLSV